MRSDQIFARILLLFAHPDDEFACSISIRDMAAANEVHCAYLTDGGYGGQSTARRKAESERVLAGLGVPAAHVHFLGERHGIQDGRLHGQLDKAEGAVNELLATIGPIQALYLPAWEGGHQDHDAIHLLGVVMANRLRVAEVWQFPLYHGSGLPGPLFKVLSPLLANGPIVRRQASFAERLLALRLCLMYASQWRTWLGLLPMLAMHMLVDGSFSLQAVSMSRLNESPHPGRPLFERRGFLSYGEFRVAADRYLARHLASDVN